MSKAASPTRFSGDMDHFYDPNFTQEISQKMRVPKRIKVDGETEDILTNNLPLSSWHQNDKIEMHVPDRILVMGQEQHFGTRAPPRELQLENSVMPPDPGVVRVQTPPRVIKLDEHYFPSADDEFTPRQQHSEPLPVSRPDHNSRALDISTDQRSAQRELYSMEGMSTAEEVVHLRRQLAKLNRRVMAMELNAQQQWHREKILYFTMTAYILFKGLIWLNRCMNKWLIFSILALMLISDVQPDQFIRFPPPWTRDELEAGDDMNKNILGYCEEEGARCGHTVNTFGSMGGRWAYCCPGLWCAPDPKHSKELYSISCGAQTQFPESCWYYEYLYTKSYCIKDDQYPTLPADYKRYDEHDPPEGRPVFHDEN